MAASNSSVVGKGLTHPMISRRLYPYQMGESKCKAILHIVLASGRIRANILEIIGRLRRKASQHDKNSQLA